MFVTVGISTVWAQESNYLQIEDMQAEQGGQAVLSVLLSNVDEVCAYSFELTLPEGVTIAKNEKDKFKVDTGTRADDHTISINLEDETYYLACLSLTSAPFSSNSGSVCNITLSIDESVDLGDKTIEIINIELVNPNNTIYHPDNTSSTLSVVAPTPKYADGYKVWIEPFTLTEDREDIEILLDNVNEIQSVEFDLLLPMEFINKEAYSVTLGTSTSSTKKYTATIDDNEDGSLHLSCVRKGTNVIPKDAGCVLQLGLWFSDEDEYPIVNSGIYESVVKNVVITDVESNTYEAVPVSGYFKVGTEAKGDFILTGDITSVDLTDMDVDKTTNVVLSNPNAVIYIENGKSIKNENNVVIGDECASLVLTDGYDFMAPKAFTASTATYEANVSSSLGYKTLVLPYDCNVPTGFEAYEVSGIYNNSLMATQLTSIKANSPVILKNEGTATLSATEVEIAAAGEDLIAGELIGTYEETDAPVGSYVLQNQDGEVAFYLVGTDVQPKVGAFRAYLKPQTAGAKALKTNFSGFATGIDSYEGTHDATTVYSVSGQQMNKVQRGVNIIRTGKSAKKAYVK